MSEFVTRRAVMAIGSAALAVVLLRKMMQARTCVSGGVGGRPLGPTETAVVKHSRFCRGSMRVALVLRLHGSHPLTVEALQSAVNALCIRHPVMRSVVTRTSGSTVHDETYALGPSASGNVVVQVGSQGGTWQDEWENLQHKPLALGGPLAQVVLVTPEKASLDGNHTVEIILAVEHAFCDGISIGHLGHELLLAVGASSIDDDGTVLGPPLLWSESMEDLAMETTGGWGPISILRRIWLVLQLIRMASGTPKVAMFPRADEGAAVSETTLCTTAQEHAELTNDETSAFIAACRNHGVTVTSAVGAVQLQTAADIITARRSADSVVGDKMGIPLAVGTVWGAETRRWYKPSPLPQHHVAFHVGGIPAFSASFGGPTTILTEAGGTVDTMSTEYLWILAAAARRHLVRMTEASIPLAIALVVSSMYTATAVLGPRVMPFEEKARPPFTTSVSSWGLMPFLHTYGHADDLWTLDAVIPVVNMSYTPFPISLVTTAAGKLTVTLLAGTPAVSRLALRELRDGMLLRLRVMSLD